MRASQPLSRLVKRSNPLITGLLLVIVAGHGSAQDAVNLNNIVHSKLPGDNIQINLVTDGNVGAPGTFSTTNPARIALDFFGMKKQLANDMVKISEGNVDSVVAVETQDRTRVIINLISSSRYDVIESDDGYAVIVYNTNIDNSVRTELKPFKKRSDILPDTLVSNIDFRRSEAGGGSLTVDLSEEGTTIDTREQDGEIIVDLLGVTLPTELERRLDVIDFATPVRTVDAFQNSDNVRLVIVPQGDHQHLSFQAGNRFTLVVDPVVITEQEKKNEADQLLGYGGDRLSINFQKIEVRAALAVIADFTGINFVTSDSVQGDITINLKDVPWDQALDVIMKTRGLSKRQTGNVIWVAPSQEIAKFEEEQLKANAVAAEYAPLVSEIIQINYAKAADIADVIKSVKVVKQGAISSSSAANSSFASSLNVTETDKNSLLTGRGSVTVDVRTNSLLVQDVAGKIKELRGVIAKLDKPVRQVLIETRIVEANDTFSRELGARLGFQRITAEAQFSGASGSNLGTFIGSGSTEGSTAIVDSLNDDEPGIIYDVSRGNPGGLAVDLGANSIGGDNPSSYAFNLFRAGTGFDHLITLELSALEADGRGRIVASPRLVTSNQRQASISQGVEQFVTIPGNGGGDGGGGLEKIEAELRLVVTPQITPDDRVIMDVIINQDRLISSQLVGTKEIKTQVLADNGETIIIGGIYQEDEADDVVKVPFLGDVPILGRLFKKKSTRNNRTELLIFLTPKIISPKLNLG
ncbi:MAG: type IV pilus assembly protein PilQ [Arenicella sp.]|jgi:type IV pilus assembly protein PilQ